MQTISPDRDDYPATCRLLERTLFSQGAAFVKLHARDTTYQMVLARHTPTMSPLPRFGKPDGLGDRDYISVSVIGHGAYWFDPSSYLAPAYVADKLNVAGGDGEVLAEFLTRLGASRKVVDAN